MSRSSNGCIACKRIYTDPGQQDPAALFARMINDTSVPFVDVPFVNDGAGAHVCVECAERVCRTLLRNSDTPHGRQMLTTLTARR